MKVGEPLAPMAPSGPIGLLAGWGTYPLVIARTLRAQGFDVIGLGVRDHVDPQFEQYCSAYRTIGVAKLGQAVRFLRQHQVRRATMAGKIHKVLLFRRFYWLRHVPDWYFLKTFYPHFITLTQDRRDDTMLGTIVGAFAKEGIEFAPATDFAPELLIKEGQLAGGRLTHSQRKDIAFGWKLATEMGRLDVGQSVAVRGRAVLAVEAVEGTDACIRRAGQLCPAGGFTVVKVAKPQQDMRFDVPTIGVGTIETMREAGGKVLAVEADRTILLEQADVLQAAQQAGITLIALKSPPTVAEEVPDVTRKVASYGVDECR